MLLRQLRSRATDAVYVAADTLGPGESLAELIRTLHDSYRVRSFYVDEIHFVPNFSAILKELYDFYDLSVWFSSSSALALHESAWDLSRRVLRMPLSPLSYREYLWFGTGRRFDPLGLDRECIGALREEFAAAALRQHGVRFEYAKSVRGAKVPDFVVRTADGNAVIEIGGRGKGRSQFKGLEYDRKVVAYHGDARTPEPGMSIPLHCLGFP